MNSTFKSLLVGGGLTLLMIPATTGIAVAASDDHARVAPAVMAFDQRAAGKAVTISYVHLPKSGYLVIYGSDSDGKPSGDPLGTGEGASSLPDLQEEFMFRRGPDMPFVQAAEQSRARLGFYKALPIESQPDTQMAVTADGRVQANALHCQQYAGPIFCRHSIWPGRKHFLIRRD